MAGTFLQLGGIVVPIQRTGATQRAPEKLGDRGRAYAGNWISTVRAEKRVWDFTTGPLLPQEFEDLAAVCALDAEITMSGDCVGLGIVTVIVEMGDVEFLSDGTVDGFLRIAKFTAREAE